MNDYRNRMERLLASLSQGAYEREEVIALALLAALSGESIFLLGLPGVGKSMVARRLKMAFRDARGFEYLMSRFSTPDEIFGPVSISRLKNDDTYERIVEGYLPTADVVFLDEIWKAGPAIQNSLLTVLNERIFRNGSYDIRLPLKVIISASNELPAEGEGLEALWDRFLLRYVVEPIRDRETFLSLLTARSVDCHVAPDDQITDDECRQMMEESESILVPQSILDIILDLRDILSSEIQAMKYMPTASALPYVSDRRWRKVMTLLRMSALLNGRQEVNPSDCLLLEYMLWDNTDQVTGIKKVVADVLVKHLSIDIPRQLTAYDLDELTLTEPAGDLLSPDGKHYVFTAGGEDIMISIDEYDTLSSDVRFGSMTSDNRLVLTAGRGAFTIRKMNEGQITLNSFTYLMKRDSPLRTGNVDSMLKVINRKAERLAAYMDDMIAGNIFLRESSAYEELHKAIDDIKFTQEELRSK